MAAAHISGDDTRSRVLDVALELIAEKGFASTSTRELSERLGFTKAALYYHFRTKDDLLAALIGPILDDLSALIDDAEPRSSAPGRRRALAGYVEFVSAHENIIRVLSQDPSVSKLAALKPAGPVYQRLTRLLTGCEDPGTVPRARVRAALGAIHAVILHAAPGDDRTIVTDTALIAGCGALGIPGPPCGGRGGT